MGRVTSDVVRGMSVTQFIGVGHIAIVEGKERQGATRFNKVPKFRL